ncbi:chromosome segregation protein [Endobacter medicaginis]|uniref:Chromosome partition protein Smc n=3 Tax=Endobacter medicaginis TaxID=1181271 RepID=A0A839UV87_9PROT|nr:AAA family ATPase [Endobacter medicaginis]MBB3172545.1 chromosome segregation protein [Endobacter medicaginis]MCX5473967.1 AAA family ATPase [Endobacter medicaginis]
MPPHPVRFVRLRIAGFKSFAEPASVEILPGLTGIVGPNGCGKSNVVEALRWAMGESSARALRGGEMDDVIFAGTAARAARNLAEVTVTMEGAAGLAPQPFHDADELQITRRIERGAGSAYRINGRDARARDVQTLFADLASGARSSAMVSQGRVAAIVGARPEERRAILEEAAGITGLHARRHEAELKLRATEANLARAEDVRLGLEARLGALGEQAKQAARYRVVAVALREAETTLDALIHARAHEAVRRGREALATTRAAAETGAAEAAAREATLAEATARLPPLREAESEARTERERRRIALEALAEALARDEAELAALRERLAQAEADRDAARARRDAAAETLVGLEAELEEIDAWLAALPERLEASEAALTTARAEETRAAETLRLAVERRDAARETARDILTQHDDAAATLERLTLRLTALEADIADATAATPDAERQDAARSAQRDAEDAAAAARTALDAAMQARAAAAAALVEAREHHAEAVRAHEAVRRQHEALTARAAKLAETDATLATQEEQARGLLCPEATQAAQATVTRLETEAETARQALAECGNARATAVAAADETRAVAMAARAARERCVSAAQAARARASRLDGLHATLSRDHDAALTALPDPAIASAARDAAAAAEIALAQAAQALDDAQTQAEADETQARADEAARHAAATALAGLRAQIEGLSGGLGGDPAGGSGAALPPVAARLRIPQGLEPALAACLGDGLDAPLQRRADGPWWRPDGTPAPVPQGATGLAGLIEATDAEARDWVMRTLGGVGLIETNAEPAALLPGQMLVSRAGGLWRWDGYVRPPGHDPAAERLAQRARLGRLRAQETAAAAALPDLATRADAAAAQATASATALRAARLARDEAERTAVGARAAQARAEAEATARRSRLDALTPQLEQLTAERDEARAALEQAEAALRDSDDPAGAATSAAQARTAAETAERAERSAREHLRDLEGRLADARRQAAAAGARQAEADSRLGSLAPQRKRIAAERQDIATAQAELTTRLAALPALPFLAEAASEASRLDAEAECALTAATAAREAAERLRGECVAQTASLAAQADTQAARLAALTPQAAALREDHHAATLRLAGLVDALSSLPDAALLAGLAEAAAQSAHEAGAARATAQAEHDALSAERHGRQARRAGLSGERDRWAAQLATGDAALAEWQARTETLLTGVAQAEATPRAARARSDDAQAAAAAAGAHWLEAQAALADAEAALAAAQRAARGADLGSAVAREAQARAETQHAQAEEALSALLAATEQENRALPTFVPDDLSDAAETGLRRKVARLLRERDEIGPVNLRAEIEAQALSDEAGTLLREREEIESAIARLRGTIGNLNREGRERLGAVYRQVDAQFQTLFARMFGGGRAHLGLVGSDDPLEAGLEIYAQPPGKKLATLSLLSGGEQALTALSLIFAVFGCNPAPVCVLDEVDAPLDDANVQRFATLLGDMVSSTGTRFLVVTHHQLTMAHMDRLYGVTMQERGVSRLLSVDLQAASAMVERG